MPVWRGNRGPSRACVPTTCRPCPQRYLEENELLIKAIVENQNVGRLNECIKYQVGTEDGRTVHQGGCRGASLATSRACVCHGLQEKLQTNIIFLSALAERQVAVMQKEADAAAEAGPAGAEVAGGPGEG